MHLKFETFDLHPIVKNMVIMNACKFDCIQFGSLEFSTLTAAMSSRITSSEYDAPTSIVSLIFPGKLIASNAVS